VETPSGNAEGKKLKGGFWSPVGKAALRDAFDSLDKGKRFVSEGQDWLERELF
jgi:hypothetical protein